MPSDYTRIAEENITKYGTDIDSYGPVLLANLYSDRTHFVYELLQNAEDAGASKVSFQLFRDRLEMRHDGRPFDQDDVRGICGLAVGTKKSDLTKIGKFGIGFKSVYAYTNSPEIHSGDEHFLIEHYVRPRAAERRTIEHDQTLIVLPFEHPELACLEIGQRLSTLSARTLLFLYNIVEVVWSIEGGAAGHYLRESRQYQTANRVVLIGVNQGNETYDEWLIFARPVPISADLALTAEVAYRLEKDAQTGTEQIVAVHDSRLVVFFPTETETHLKFLVQGPFRTTPARENIPQYDPLNQRLIQEIATLIVESLTDLKKMRLLNTGLLNSLPLKSLEFPQGGMFRPVFEHIRTALKENPLLPTSDGSFVAARNAKLARGTELRKLLSNLQLRQLYGISDELRWLSDDITQDKMPDLLAYLRQELGIEEVTPEIFATRFSASFAKQQIDEWMIKFYDFLGDQAALWRAPRYSGDRPPLRLKPFIRLQDGEHVPPFRADGSPTAYLPPVDKTDFPIVKREIAKAIEAREFLQKLGFTEPNIVVEVLENILPKYESQGSSSIGSSEHERDIQKILRALETDSASRKEELIRKLKATPFALAENASSGDREYKRPDTVYLRTKVLEEYFSGNSEAWFIAERSRALMAHIKEIGVEDKPRRIRRDGVLAWDEKRSIRGSAGCSYDLGIDDYDLDGLTVFLSRVETSDPRDVNELPSLLWGLLLSLAAVLPAWNRGVFFHGEYRWFYRSQRSAHFDASFTKDLKSRVWLPDRDGKLHRPGDLTLSDLPDGFEKDEWLTDRLGMRPDAVGALAKALGADPKDIADYLSSKSEFEEFRKWKTEQRQKDGAKRTNSDSAAALDYAEALKDAFARPGRNGDENGPVPVTPVADPGRYRQRTENEIRANKDLEPDIEDRFKVGKFRRWEDKNPDVRSFLSKEYDGRCQVCEETFTKRNGEPYFEGLYLVSHTKAGWIDQRGNVLCLCANCCARFIHGSVEADDILEQVGGFRGLREGGTASPALRIKLCGEGTLVQFTERHMIALQALLNVSQEVKSHDE
jgi:hypothetical protein